MIGQPEIIEKSANMDHKKRWREAAKVRGLNMTERVDSSFIWRMMHLRPKTRDEYIALMEFCYNYGGGTDFPPHVFVELTSHCNLKCTICHHADMKRPRQDLPEAIGRKVVDECAEYGTWYLTYQFYGEPLLRWRYLVKMVDYAKKRGIPCVATATNVTLMDEEIARALVLSGLDSLCVSFDGSSPSKYAEIRGADYEDVASRIRMVRNVRDRLKSPTPFISMTLVRTDETDEELDRFVEECTPYIESFDNGMQRKI